MLARSIESIKWIVMVEVNCETDFVAKDKNFLNFCNKVLESAQELHKSDEQLKRISEEVEEAMSNPNSKNRSKYEEIRKLNLHKMESIPVCKIPK